MRNIGDIFWKRLLPIEVGLLLIWFTGLFLWIYFNVPFTPPQTRFINYYLIVMVPLIVISGSSLAYFWWKPIQQFSDLYDSGNIIEKTINEKAKQAALSIANKTNIMIVIVFMGGSLIAAIILAAFYDLQFWQAIRLICAGLTGSLGMLFFSTYIIKREIRPILKAIGE